MAPARPAPGLRALLWRQIERYRPESVTPERRPRIEALFARYGDTVEGLEAIAVGEGWKTLGSALGPNAHKRDDWREQRMVELVETYGTHAVRLLLATERRTEAAS